MSRYPKSLPIFFSTELWERYGFYVVQSLLALYLTSQYKLTDAETYSLVASLTALTYVSPIFGGYIADNWLGQKMSVLVGAVVLAVNYFLLALNISFYFMTFSLAGVAVGTGLLKPNISSLLGRQFKKNCPKRERGFIIFYMGITAGIVLGTTVPPLLQQSYGWYACFFSAAIGLLVALATFSFGIKYFNVVDYAKVEEEKIYARFKAGMLLVVLWNLAFIVLSRPNIATFFFVLVICFTFAYLIKLIRIEKGEQRKRVISMLLLCVLSVLFWTFYFQMFLSLTLFITRAVKLKVLGIYFPAPYYIAVESVAMIILGFIFTRYNLIKSKKHVAISTATKFTLSLFLMLIAYLLIIFSMHGVKGNVRIEPTFILLGYSVIAGAELLLSPVGIAAFTVLARPKRVSTMMGIFFISLGLGGFFSGYLAKLSSVNSAQTSLLLLRENYEHAFVILAMLLFGALCIGIAFTWIIHRFFPANVTKKA
jgi:POT family proton-dependent oligopeptide transporter